MKSDLSGCRAKLEWANTQIKTLDSQIHRFVGTKPYSISEDADAETQTRIYKLNLSSPVPEVIRVGIGQIIAAQRDSLDYLAVTLAKRNGAEAIKDVSFPFASSDEDFARKTAQNKIAKVSDVDRQIIASLQPYDGGNEMLVAINTLNNEGKHREPIITIDGASLIGFSMAATPGMGGGPVRRIRIFGPFNPTYPGVPYVIFEGDPNVDLHLAIQISFGEAVWGAPRPVIETLNEFSRLTNAIITLFDD